MDTIRLEKYEGNSIDSESNKVKKVEGYSIWKGDKWIRNIDKDMSNEVIGRIIKYAMEGG